MMNIIFSPQYGAGTPVVSKAGAVITVNDKSFDSAALANGDVVAKADLPSNSTLGISKDAGGTVTVKILWGYTVHTNINCFPAPITGAADGAIAPQGTTVA